MSDTLTITLTPEIKAVLDDLTQAEGVSAESVVQAAIENYLAVRTFRELRAELIQKSQNHYTDEDIFEMVS